MKMQIQTKKNYRTCNLVDITEMTMTVLLDLYSNR